MEIVKETLPKNGVVVIPGKDGGAPPPEKAPLQQWADLISKEHGTRLAPKGFKKKDGKVIVNLDYLTRDRFVNAGEAVVHVFNYYVQRIGTVLDNACKEASHSIDTLQREYDSLPFYRFKKRRETLHNLIELRGALEAWKESVKILTNTKP